MKNQDRDKDIERWQEELYKPCRYKVIYGGRGSGKSFAVADALLILSLYKKNLVLCGREFQNSIKDSVHSLLQQRIEALGLLDYYEITRDEIFCSYSGSRFIETRFSVVIQGVVSYLKVLGIMSTVSSLCQVSLIYGLKRPTL